MKNEKPYWEMTTAELRQATHQYDAPMPGLPGKPLSAAGKKDLARARRRGRPRVGMGAEKIRISLERKLLGKTDLAAKRLHLSRSELIAKSLRQTLNLAS